MKERKSNEPFWKMDAEDAEEAFKNVIAYDKKTKYEPPRFVFFVNDSFLAGRDNYKGLATQNSFILLDGKPKTKKSTWVRMMAAAHLSSRGVYENVKSTMNINQHFVIFDSEQSKEEFEGMISNIIKISGNEEKPDNLHAFNLKFMDPVERINFVLWKVKNMVDRYTRNGRIKTEDKIGTIVIDHGADFVNDVNDNKEIKGFFQFINMLIKMTGALIVVIMHKNKNNNEPTGALGYELQKKCSIYITVCKDKGRDGPLDPSRLYLDEVRIPTHFKSFLFNYEKDYPVIVT